MRYSNIYVFLIIQTIIAFRNQQLNRRPSDIIARYNASASCIPEKLFWDNYSRKFVAEQGRAAKVSSGPKVMFYWYDTKPIVRKVFDLQKTVIDKAMWEIKALFFFQKIERVVRIICCTKSQDKVSLFMDRLLGSVYDKLAEFQAFDWPEKLRMVSHVTQSFAQMHGMQYIHGDIKSANVAFNRESNGLRIIDLGMVSKIGQDFKGYTRFYVAPELISGPYHVRHAHYSQDVWSWGVTLYEMFVPGLGNAIEALNNNSLPQVIDEIVLGKMNEMLYQMQQSTGLPLYNVISSWMVFDPLNRPTMHQMYEALTKLHMMAYNQRVEQASPIRLSPHNQIRRNQGPR